ncbi:hypothetical protein [Hyphobacterium marinum]|uniref:Uncharacterized protein n=1 Tax=Hyphobacterium marinum TaxID=3116574 RepID=A0ABU7LVW0_9PROT|nr:hypothetical protein [Hyphobacterium sp. Y6023]MEE2565698.1 hypothetical protein [Hyphobacterium sp. Y6023]
MSIGNLAKTAKVAALLAFLLPWVTFSCSGETFARASGLDLAIGQITVADINTGEPERETMSPVLPVLAAAILLAAGLVAGFVMTSRRKNAVMAAAAGLALASSFYGISTLEDEMVRQARESDTADSYGMSEGIARQIRVQEQAGYWFALAAMLSATVLAGAAASGMRLSRED